MHRIVAIILICCFIAVMLAGCFDANEIDDMSFVLALGIDKGKTDTWQLAIEYPSMKSSESGGSETGGKGGGSSSESGGSGTGSKGGGSSSTSTDGYETLTIEAPDFFTGLNMINSTLPRKLNFEHTKYLIVSEEVAKSGELKELFNQLIRFRQIRRTIHVIISKDSATDFIKANKPSIGTTLSKSMELMISEADNTGFFPHATLGNIYDDINSTYHQPVAALGAVNHFNNLKSNENSEKTTSRQDGKLYAGQLPRQGGSSIELMGCAVFDSGTMVGELNGEENRFMLIANGNFRRSFFSMQDPKSPNHIISFNVQLNKKPQVKIKFNGDKPIINLKVELEGDILAIQSGINYETPESIPVLENLFAHEIKTGLDATIKKCIGMRADVFKFGDVAAMQFSTIQEWEKFNWLKKFENSDVTTEVSFKIGHSGKILKSSP